MEFRFFELNYSSVCVFHACKVHTKFPSSTLYLAWTTNVARPAVLHYDVTYTDFHVPPLKDWKFNTEFNSKAIACV